MRGVLFQTQHGWFVFLSSMDVMFTSLVLTMGGVELNSIAAAVIERGGIPGMAAFKFTMVVMIILIVETIGRMRYSTGKRVAEWEVALTCIPVAVSFAQLFAVTLGYHFGGIAT